MTIEHFFAVALFALVTTGTPGPNNIMFAASGANYGIRKTLPHMLGVNLGLGSLHLLMGLGLGAVFLNFPLLQQVLKVVETFAQKCIDFFVKYFNEKLITRV